MTKLLTLRRGFAAVGLIAVGLVAAALVLTDWLHLQPCPLCVFQRLLYLLVAIFALAVAAWPRARWVAGGLALLTALGGLATAAYQSWMQAHPALFAECGIGVPTTPIEKLVDWLGRLMPWLFSAWGECTSREWVFLGLSLANWSAVMFLALAAAIAVLLKTGRLR